MDLEVTVTAASLDDVVDKVFIGEDEFVGVTLGDVIAKALVDRLTADERWPDLADRFAAAAERYLAAAAAGFIESLVAGEVARQLDEIDSRAMVRGKPSTKAEAIVAGEVTTAVREAFTPVITRALSGLEKDLKKAADEAVAAFRAGHAPSWAAR